MDTFGGFLPLTACQGCEQASEASPASRIPNPVPSMCATATPRRTNFHVAIAVSWV